ncbi:hypothetical protein UNDYM_5955 (plasmid) [Undibacterium sp. YM2]|uniref:hypothetical protein n=1 Tax=Undibacterium sp. YM2 TaxID=2058625 RepID=UPI001331E247|nr:hypothetical protein [Undibacterium sp. YM2]BBB70208.1 hypothetical protein UNDYM_5955 [Undibacterium sp. YM2]
MENKSQSVVTQNNKSTLAMLEGFLSQPQAEPGTVALVVADGTVLATVTTAPNGRFELEYPTVPANAVLYGFPNLTLTQSQISEGITLDVDRSIYEAIPPVVPQPGQLIYLNEASTATRAVLIHNSEFSSDQADAHVKAHLFGATATAFMPGYTAPFLLHIAAPNVLNRSKLKASISEAGEISAWSNKIAKTPPPRFSLFATPGLRPTITSELSVTSLAVDNAPVITASATWASNDTTWMDVLNAQDGTFADSMGDLAQTTDGVAASVMEDAFETTASDLLSFGAKSFAGGMASAVGSQIMSLVCSWIFGDKSNPIATALQNIENELTTVINNQLKIIQQLSAVLTDLHQLELNVLSAQMTTAVANVQSTVQTITGYTTTTKGIDPSQISAIATKILDPNDGVTDSIQIIHDTIMGTGMATPLPVALQNAIINAGGVYGTAQNFLSNESCFATAQWLFHYYSVIQTQGVQLVIQAQNYQANASVDSPNTNLTISTSAKAFYNAWLIGGSGIGNAVPNITQQRDLYRATFWQYFKSFATLLGPLPDDMAVAYIPEVVGQPGNIYYETQSQLLVLGHLSGKLRNWSAGTDVLSVNSGLIGTPWSLPAMLNTWRYPMQAEFGKIFQPTTGISRYNNIFQYLYDQGFNDDRSDYGATFSFSSLFAADGTGYEGSAWFVRTNSWVKPAPFAHPPFDIDGNQVSENMWKDGGSPYNSWHYEFQGTWPSALQSNNSYTYFSSKCYNIYSPGDPSQAWAHPWFAVSGGIVVTDLLANYLPAGSYLDSCSNITIIFTCTALLSDGTYGSVSFDLTSSGDVALSIVDGAASIVNPYLPPLVNGIPAFTPGPRTGFLPPGNYTGCTNVEVQLRCNADNGSGQNVPASFNLTPYTFSGVAIANTNGVLTS